MSFAAAAWLIDNYNAKCHQWRAMLCLSDWVDEDGVCFPSFKTLADRLDRDDRSAYRVIGELEDLGDICVVRPSITGSGHHNIYVVITEQNEAGLARILRENPTINKNTTVAHPESVAATVFKRRAKAAGQPKAKPDPVKGEDDWLPPANEQVDLFAAGSIPTPKGWDQKKLAALQQSIEGTDAKWKDGHKTLLTYLIYVTDWDLPPSRSLKQWAATFEDHTERFGVAVYTGQLYEDAWGRLYQARVHNPSLSLPARPSTLTNTMSELHEMRKGQERRGGISGDQLERMLDDAISTSSTATK